MPDYKNRLKDIAQDQNREWFKITNKADDNSARIDLMDEVGYFGVSAAEFVNQLNDLDAKEIALHINSPGGDVFDGITIYNALKDHPANVTATVDGVAASAASFIAMAADYIIMNRNSEMMIHEAAALCIGNASDMIDVANRLDKMSDNIASIYAERAGGTTDSWRAAMQDESWYSPDEAVEAGLADAVASTRGAKTAKAKFDLSIFNHAGRDNAPAPALDTKDETLADTVSNKQDQESQSMTPEQLKVIKLPEDATEEQVNARLAVLNALEIEDASESETDEADSADETSGDETTEETVEETETSSVVVPEGSVLVDAKAFEQLRAQAHANSLALDKFQKDQDETDRDKFINSAISDGRVAPAQRKHYEKMWLKDKKGVQDLITSFPKNTIPVTETGRGDETETAEDTTSYPTAFLTPSERNRIKALQEA